MKKVLFLLFICINGFAQKPIGRFLQDSVKVGSEIKFAFSFKHDPSDEIVFPDSSYNYGNFIFKDKDVFETKSKSNYSLDSAVFTFVNFEIDEIQTLSLPVYLLYGQDSLRINSVEDSLFTIQQITDKNLKEVPLEYDLDYVEIKDNFAIYRIVFIGLVLLVLLISLLLFFRKNIEKKYKEIEHLIRHKRFISKHKEFEKGKLNSEKVNAVLVNWKNYLELIEEKPYSTFSSSEISATIENKRLLEALKEIDAAIYGNYISSSVPFALIILRNIAEERYKIFKQKNK